MSIRVPYDSLTLFAVTSELRSLVVGGQLQHVSQPAPTDLILTVRNHGANHAILLSCDANWARAHITQVRRKNPSNAPAFCMLCRKYLEGATLISVKQRDLDRILELHFEFGDGTGYRLIAELMGRHSNLILVGEDGLILDAAKRITHKLNRHRELLPTRPYLLPPQQNQRLSLFSPMAEALEGVTEAEIADQTTLATTLAKRIAGMSPFLAAELAARMRGWEGPLLPLMKQAQAQRFSPVVIRNGHGEPIGAYPFATLQFPESDQHPRDSISLALDNYYSVAIPRSIRDSVHHELEVGIDRSIKSRQRQIESIGRSLAECERMEEFKQVGELLLANLYQIEPEADSVTVLDYYAEGAPERLIPLDPQKSAQENAETWFRRYRKARDGKEIQGRQLRRVVAEIEFLESARIRLEEADEFAQMRALQADLVAEGLLRASADPEGSVGKKGPDFDGKKIRVYHTPEGFDIYLGENAEANDYLTSRVAQPNDLWLHVRAAASAHVVVRSATRGATVPQSVLKLAATLAAQHSASKHASLVPVDYTLKKYVRRPRKAAPGAALYQNEKTIYVSPKDGA